MKPTDRAPGHASVDGLLVRPSVDPQLMAKETSVRCSRRGLLARGAAVVVAAGLTGRDVAAAAPAPLVRDLAFRDPLELAAVAVAVGDGVTDDTQAVQTAVLAAAAQGRPLLVPNGTYLLSATVFLPSGAHVQGLGADQTVFRAAPNHAGSVFANGDQIRGNSDIVLEDLQVDGNRLARAAGSSNIRVVTRGTATGRCRRVAIRRCYVHGAKEIGIQLANVQDGEVTACRVAHNDRDGISLYYSCSDVRVHDNFVFDVGDDHIGCNAENVGTGGHRMESISIRNNRLGPSEARHGANIACHGLADSTIADNLCYQGMAAGISVANWNGTEAAGLMITGNAVFDVGRHNTLREGAGILVAGARSVSSTDGRAGCRDILINGNVIRGSRQHGIRIVSAAGGAVSRVRIAGNEIGWDPGLIHVLAGTRGIAADRAEAPIDDLVIERNVITGSPSEGVWVGGGGAGYRTVAVRENLITGSGERRPAAGLHFADVDGLEVVRNRCVDPRAQPTQTYGVALVRERGHVHLADNVLAPNRNGEVWRERSGVTETTRPREPVPVQPSRPASAGPATMPPEARGGGVLTPKAVRAAVRQPHVAREKTVRPAGRAARRAGRARKTRSRPARQRRRTRRASRP